MRILAINCGSSSLKCALIDSASGAHLRDVHLDAGSATTQETLGRALDEIGAAAAQPDAVAHRIVHGGASFSAPVVVDDDILTRLEDLSTLAPLHNPPALAALRAARVRLSLPHVAVFDTAFHSTLPPRAREYALPRELCARLGIRRYGFHGINHAHVMRAVAAHLGRAAQELRIVSCHLGNG